MGWNKDHTHEWELRLDITWVVDGIVFCAVCCKCGKAGWKKSPMQQVQATEYS